MATRRQGKRRIVVDGKPLYWSTRPSDEVQMLARIQVCTEATFDNGGHGQWLTFVLPPTVEICPEVPGYLRHVEQTPRWIAPVIAHAIVDHAYTRQRADLELPLAAVTRALALSLVELVDHELAEATEIVRTGDARSLREPLAHLTRLIAYVPRIVDQLDDWLACHADLLRTLTGARDWLDKDVQARCATLAIELP